MGRYLLCREPLAALPYYIESIQLNIYSPQELCLLLNAEPELTDEGLINAQLAEWLEKECFMPVLGKKIAKLTEAKGSEKEAARLILKSTNFYTGTELRKAFDNLDGFFALSSSEQLKKRGDMFVRHGKYESALKIYTGILTESGLPEKLKSDLYYNCGCVNARLFRSGRALECFARAYMLTPVPEFRKAYLCAAFFDGGEERMKKEAGQLGASDAEVKTLLESFDKLEIPEAPEDPDALTEKWIHDYRECV